MPVLLGYLDKRFTFGSEIGKRSIGLTILEHGKNGKKEQGAGKNEKEAKKRGRWSKQGKSKRSREQGGKIGKEQGARTPPNRGSQMTYIVLSDNYFSPHDNLHHFS